MNVVAIDPGGTIGVARIFPDGQVTVMQTHDLQEALGLCYLLRRQVHVVVEDFSAAGRASADGKLTMNQVGGVTAWCTWMNIPYTCWGSQKRLSGLAEAQRIVDELLAGQTVAERRHAADALAHAIVWNRMKGGG